MGCQTQSAAVSPRVTAGEKVRRETCFWAPGLLLLANLARDPVPIFPFSLPGKCFKSDNIGALGFLNSVYGTEKPRSSVGRAAAAPRTGRRSTFPEREARVRARGNGARGEASDFDRLTGGL